MPSISTNCNKCWTTCQSFRKNCGTHDWTVITHRILADWPEGGYKDLATGPPYGTPGDGDLWFSTRSFYLHSGVNAWSPQIASRGCPGDLRPCLSAGSLNKKFDAILKGLFSFFEYPKRRCTWDDVFSNHTFKTNPCFQNMLKIINPCSQIEKIHQRTII